MAGTSLNRHSMSTGEALNSGESDRGRTLTLRELRPFTLIGQSHPLFPWETARHKDPQKIKSRPVRNFYEHQNGIIDSLEEVDDMLDTGIHASLLEEYGDDIGEVTPRQRARQPRTLCSSADEESQLLPDKRSFEQSRIVQFWINMNMAANVLLLLGKFIVFMMTDSLSIVASLVDSVLDLLSTLIIYVSANFADQRDWKTKQLYPVGRSRLEPIGVLVFSVIMVVSFIKIAQEALEAIFTAKELHPVYLGTASIIVMLTTIGIKAVLWYLCKDVRSSSVRALSQDAATDCVFNTLSILFPLLSQVTNSGLLDPIGALFLAVYVVWSWSDTAMEHINNLTGAACSPEERQQLLYLCVRFSERIVCINVLNAYHAGDRLMCEVDILLDPQLAMRDAHDIAEALQYALETLPIVERAFVHIDYRRDNFSGHVV